MALRGECSILHQIRAGHKPITDASEILLDFIYVGPFQNEIDSKAIEIENWRQISHFSLDPVQIRVGMGKCLSQFFGLDLRPKVSYTFDKGGGRSTVMGD